MDAVPPDFLRTPPAKVRYVEDCPRERPCMTADDAHHDHPLHTPPNVYWMGADPAAFALTVWPVSEELTRDAA